MPHLVQLYEIVDWAIRLAMLVAVPRRRKPASAMAWLLIIFFFPIPGLVFSLLIRDYRIPRRRIQHHRIVPIPSAHPPFPHLWPSHFSES